MRQTLLYVYERYHFNIISTHPAGCDQVYHPNITNSIIPISPTPSSQYQLLHHPNITNCIIPISPLHRPNITNSIISISPTPSHRLHHPSITNCITPKSPTSSSQYHKLHHPNITNSIIPISPIPSSQYHQLHQPNTQRPLHCTFSNPPRAALMLLVMLPRVCNKIDMYTKHVSFLSHVVSHRHEA